MCSCLSRCLPDCSCRLGGNEIGDAGAVVIAEALKVNSIVHTVKLVVVSATSIYFVCDHALVASYPSVLSCSLMLNFGITADAKAVLREADQRLRL